LSWSEIDIHINFSFVVVPSSNLNITSKTKWKQKGITIAGGNKRGNQSNQLAYPQSIYVDDDQTIYIADTVDHRIMEWKRNAKNGQVVAGGNGRGNADNQLNHPVAVVVDKKTDSLIICDSWNQRLVRWSRRNAVKGTVLIINTDCYGLAMDDKEYLYIVDQKKHEVKRWRIGDANGIIVAGGKGGGTSNNQLNTPTHIFVDQNYSIYVSDSENHRVMKWEQDAKEGVVVVDERIGGNQWIKFQWPTGVIVDHLGHVYVAEGLFNSRIMRWLKGTAQGSVILGENDMGSEPNQFDRLEGLSFDEEGSIYVADSNNDRIQKFYIDTY
jgi:sugar lactone lactonase YvrE